MDEKQQPDLSPAELFPDLVKKKKNKSVPYFLLIVLCLISGFSGYVYYLAQSLPDANLLKRCLVTSMFQVRLCPGESGYVSIDSVSDVFIHALVITEDASFFYHSGVDLNEVYNTVQTSLDQGGFSRGASTITQQLVKNVFLTPERSIARKVREILVAFEVEKVLTKKQILERYINVVEFGPKIYGLQKAAFRYFQKSPSELNLLEAAYLVHLLPNPDVYSRTFERRQLTEFSASRVREISRKMALFKRITEEQFLLAESLIEYFPWSDISYEDSETLKQTLRSPY